MVFATAACILSTSELQKVLPHRQFFNIFTSKCAFRHSGVQFLISPLSTDLRTRRFNRPTFGLTRHTNHWKNTAFRDFCNIWRGCISFLLTFALLHLLSADLTTLLCFSTVHIVGSFYLNFLRPFTYRILCPTLSISISPTPKNMGLTRRSLWSRSWHHLPSLWREPVGGGGWGVRVMMMVVLFQNDESDEEILRLLYYGVLPFFFGGGGYTEMLITSPRWGNYFWYPYMVSYPFCLLVA